MAKLDNKEQVLKKALADKDSIKEVGLAQEKDTTTKEKATQCQYETCPDNPDYQIFREY